MVLTNQDECFGGRTIKPELGCVIQHGNDELINPDICLDPSVGYQKIGNK